MSFDDLLDKKTEKKKNRKFKVIYTVDVEWSDEDLKDYFGDFDLDEDDDLEEILKEAVLEQAWDIILGDGNREDEIKIKIKEEK